jgi:glutamine phosphoribosylpyrophosphate amidotransferase
MCGVLGITIKNFAKKDHDLVRGLFIQSMIRGKHATGVSYVKNGKVFTDKKSVPADEFINNQNLEDWTNEDGHLYCVGHIRYSTSDLRYNQPMASDKLSVVHNGVISQEPPETWENKYKLRTETSNDSELVLRAMEKDLNPLQHFDPASMAVCALYDDKRIVAFRNAERPLYYAYDINHIIFTSTEDIAKRSNLTNIQKTSMITMYTVEHFQMNAVNYILRNSNAEDLQ